MYTAVGGQTQDLPLTVMLTKTGWTIEFFTDTKIYDHLKKADS